MANVTAKANVRPIGSTVWREPYNQGIVRINAVASGEAKNVDPSGAVEAAGVETKGCVVDINGSLRPGVAVTALEGGGM